MEKGFSFEEFTSCVEQIVKLSHSLLDGWQIQTKEGLENGKYITKKSTSCLQVPQDADKTRIVTFEYHIAYHISYGVPIICFNIWRQDGSLLSLEEFWASSKPLKDSNMYDTLTQMDHPVLCRPFLTLHPCKTLEIMQPFLENRFYSAFNYLKKSNKIQCAMEKTKSKTNPNRFTSTTVEVNDK